MSGKTRGVRRRTASVLLLTALVVVITLAWTGTALADRWTDISDQQWINSYGVTATQAATVADGYSDGTFKPARAVTRGQFAKMVVDGFGVAPANPASPTFRDVARGSTFYTWIEGGAAAGLISGYADGTYKPNSNISRQQSNSILGAYLSKRELSTTGSIAGTNGTYTSLNAWYTAEGTTILARFADGTSVATVHRPYTAYLVMRDVVKGSNNRLTPGTNLNRAQAVALILRVKAGGGGTTAPTVTQVNPGAGSPAGGNSVTITGTGFSGVTAVRFGTVNATSYSVLSSTSISAVAPPGTSGTTVDVTVSNAKGTSAATSVSKYSYGAPSITGLSPNGGPAAGGNNVIITGSGFSGVTGFQGVRFGTTPATSYVVNSPTQITAVAPAGTAGAVVDVVVTNTYGSSSANDYSKYTYGVPAILELTPAAGPVTGGNTVVIKGTGFHDLSGPSAVKFGTTNATSYVVNSSSQITAVAPAQGTMEKTVDVTVTNPVGTSGSTQLSKYTYGPPTVGPTTTEAALSPKGGPSEGGNSVTIRGTGFTGVSAIKFGSAQATKYEVKSPTEIVVEAPAKAAADPIIVDVTVTTAAGTSATSEHSKYLYGVPSVTSVSPAAGPVTGGNTVVITGTNFNNVTAVKFGTKDATSYAVNSPTQITAVAPSGNGMVDVFVTNNAGTNSSALGSKYTYGSPTVTGLNPSAGPASGLNNVVITGTGFTGLSGVTAVKFGDINALNYTVNSGTQITAMAPPGVLGTTVDVTVTNPAGTSSTTGTGNDYTYSALPTVTGLDPMNGPAQGGNNVVITGTNFVGLSGATAVKFGTKNATSYTVNSPTQITAVAPAGTGTVYVTVTTPVGTSETSAASQYSYGLPAIAALSPAAGPNDGGNTVIITGSSFVNVTKVEFGTLPATSFTVNSSTQITAIAPDGPNNTTVAVTVTNPSGANPTDNSACKYRYGDPVITPPLEPNGGPAVGGNSVKIKGAGFTGTLVVKFGSNTATVTAVNADCTELTVTAPPRNVADPNPVEVRVTNAQGTATAAGAYSYGAPTVTALNPGAGPVGGGNSVVITGTGFTGASAVEFGGTSATSFVVDSATQITAVAPAQGGEPKTAYVTVTNGGVTSPQVAAAKYTWGVPVIDSLEPSGGPVGGGNYVVINGHGFTGMTGSAAVKFGTNNATSYVIDSDEKITARAPSSSEPQTVRVMVTNQAGPSADTGADDYTYGLPTVTSISPAAGPSVGGNTVTITGTALADAISVKFGGTSATIQSNSSGQVKVTAPPQGVEPITVDIIVQTATGESAVSAATKYSWGPPSVTELDPAGGSAVGGTEVIIKGTGFTGVTAVKFGTKNATSWVVDADTLDDLTQVINAVAPSGTAGTTVDVTVTTPAGTSAGVDGSKYSYGVPIVSSISPAAGTGGSTLVRIYGANFSGVTEVKFGTAPVPTGNFTVNSVNEITAVAPAKAGGDPNTVDVTVTNGAGTSSTSSGSKWSYAKPAITKVEPNNGPAGGQNYVVINGTCFTGVSAVTFGGTPAVSFTVDSPTQITARVPAGTAGFTVDVRVTNPLGDSPDAGTLDDYHYAIPTVTSLNYASGSAGDQRIITGTNFYNVTSVDFGDAPVVSYTVDSSTKITVTVPTKDGADPITVYVTVTTGAGTSDTVPGSKFTYGEPDITLLNPTGGPIAGGNTVVITGVGFTGVTEVWFGGTKLASNKYTVNSDTQITAIAPAGTGIVRVKVVTYGGTSPDQDDDNYTYNP